MAILGDAVRADFSCKSYPVVVRDFEAKRRMPCVLGASNHLTPSVFMALGNAVLRYTILSVWKSRPTRRLTHARPKYRFSRSKIRVSKALFSTHALNLYRR